VNSDCSCQPYETKLKIPIRWYARPVCSTCTTIPCSRCLRGVSCAFWCNGIRKISSRASQHPDVSGYKFPWHWSSQSKLTLCFGLPDSAAGISFVALANFSRIVQEPLYILPVCLESASCVETVMSITLTRKAALWSWWENSLLEPQYLILPSTDA
jgi:hypothetical protein